MCCTEKRNLYCRTLDEWFYKSLVHFNLQSCNSSKVSCGGERKVLLIRQDRTWFSHLLTHTPDWVGSGWEPKEIFRGTLKTRLNIIFKRLFVSTSWAHFQLMLGGKKDRRSRRFCRRNKECGSVWRSGIAAKGMVVRSRGGAMCVLDSLAQLGLVRLQASLGEPSLLPRRCQLPVVV